MPDVTDLRPGDPESIAGYRVLSRLGSGGQGVVFLAAASSGDLVAIKRLLPGLGLEDTRARAQFAKEVAAARLVAPFCTAQVVDAQLEGDSPYVVSEFIPGPSLQQQIQRHGPMRGTPLQRLAIGTATALAAIHQAGVVHRDFKPANVMLSPEGPRVIDFGIARDLSTETTVTSRVFGTPAYMSPEQLRADVVGPAADIFAWASVMAYAATGKAPFEAPHIMAVVYRIGSAEPDLEGVPDELAAVLRQCLEKEPADRLTAQQALAQLLGRPTPQRDQTDPTGVLAEASGLAQPTDPGSAAVDAVAGPTVPAPIAEIPVWGTPPTAAPDLPPRDVTRPRPAPATPAPAPTSATAASESGPPSWGSPPDRTQVVSAPDPVGRPVWGAPPAPSQARRSKGALVGALTVLAIVLGGVVVFNGVLPLRSNTPNPSVLDDDPGMREAVASAIASADSYGWDDSGEPTAAPTKKNNPVTTQNRNAVPKAFVGVWTGKIASSGAVNGVSAVRLTLTSKSSTGRIRFTDLNCSGTVEVKSVLPMLLTLDAVIKLDPQQQCSKHSRVHLANPGGKQLQFTITDTDRDGWTGAGVLHR